MLVALTLEAHDQTDDPDAAVGLLIFLLLFSSAEIQQNQNKELFFKKKKNCNKCSVHKAQAFYHFESTLLIKIGNT